MIYESLAKTDDRHFHSEYYCSVGKDLILDCLKSGKTFYLEYLDGDTSVVLEKCRVVPGSLKDGGLEVSTAHGAKLRIEFDSILKSAYTIEVPM